jgi:hypothetical protein
LLGLYPRKIGIVLFVEVFMTSPETTITVSTPSPAKLLVQRGSEQFELAAGTEVKPGDIIKNAGASNSTVTSVSRIEGVPSLVSTLKPGASVKVTDRGEPTDTLLGFEAGEGESTVVDAPLEVAETGDFVINPEVDEVSGLFGAAFVPSLAGPAAAALGLAALATSRDDGQGGGEGSDTSLAGGANGLAGGVAALSTGVEQTPLAPVTAVTNPVADGLATVGEALAGADEPTGLAAALGSIVGDANSPSGGAADSGLVGLVNSLGTGIDEAFSSGQAAALAPVIDPLSQTLGSNQGQTDGVAQGLANVGSTLTEDASVLAPLTTEVLGPVVGTSPGQDGGLPQTLDQVSEGLTDLTNQDSAVAPLNAVTEPVGGVLETLADGVGTLGDGVGSVSAQDPSGLSGLVGDLLGSDTSSVSSTATSSQSSPLPVPNPLI